MKRILITGENSYIGGKFIEWVAQWPEQYHVDEISVRGDEWKQVDFSAYDSVYHVAGIAHNSSDPKLEDLYYEVNRDLTIEVAKKVKKDGVPQFVFMSSIIVYGTKTEFIDADTKPNPDNFYGESKLQAEEGILPLQDENFNIAIIRPPMIYGKGSIGNYPLLSRFAQLTPIFPDYDNQRSMLHIDNLTEFVRLLIEYDDDGIFFPQNKDYIKTSDMVQGISEVHGKKIIQTRLFNPIIKSLININLLNKVFGNLSYNLQMSDYKIDYRKRTFSESIKLTEKNGE
ncbi:NAD-dependent epimerase/dehydratase family protein [Aerococcus urinaeequi]|uniref:NAD-dependent epimerase/dehydratase family protein n=1 Tax=Aerococcus urinaeequi TaxID=51665 RepID=UPI003B3A5043